MFARITTYELEDGRASESIDVFEPAIDHIRTLDGLSTRTSSWSGTAAARSR